MSFSFCHTADIHIGKYSFGTLDSKTGIDTSTMSTLKCLDEFVNFSIENKVTFVIIAGDLSKNKTLSELERSELFKRIKKLEEAGIIVYIILGNHDESSSKGTTYNIKSLKVLGLNNVHVIDEPTLISEKEYHLIAMPFIEDVSEWIEEYKRLRRKIKNEKKIIVALHGNIQGVAKYSELLESDEPKEIPKSIFDDEQIFYVACGHQHTFQVISKKPFIAYSGSLDRVRFDERMHKKGFIHCNQIGKKKFIRVKARRFVQIEVESKSIPKEDYKNAIVKVVLNPIKRQWDSFDEEELETLLKKNGANYVIFTKMRKEKVELVRLEGKKGITFLHRINHWCENNVDKKIKDDVKKQGNRFIEEALRED